jgi:uncharacterized membrane protein YccC
MTQPDDGGIRIGREERDTAIRALDEHLSAGRIDAEEYGERAAQVYAARTWKDITPLFADLPEPRPAPIPPKPRSPSTMVPAEIHGAVRPHHRRDIGHFGRTLIALSPFIALALFVFTREWIWFLLVPVTAIIVRAISSIED